MGLALVTCVLLGCSADGGANPPLGYGDHSNAGAGATPGLTGSGGAGAGTGDAAAGAGGIFGTGATGEIVGTAATGGIVGTAAAGGMFGAAGTGGIFGTGSSGGMFGTGATGGMIGTGGAPIDLGVGDGRDVVAVGDSWMNLGSVGIQQSLLSASGQPYRTYGEPGTRMLDGVIPQQYTTAKAQNPEIKTIVMTGGGNDILQDPVVLADCVLVGPVCQQRINEVGARYQQIALEMAVDGVLDMIIVMYTRGTLLGAPVIDYVWQQFTPMCDNAPVDCHLVDPDEVAGGTMLTRDGIHPTDAGYEQLGQYVYQLMQREGMRR